MRKEYNWDDLGRTIEDVVNRAVNSRDFDKLNQTIRQVVETAVDAGGEAIRKASQTKQQTARTVREQPAPLQLYGSYSSMHTRGVLKIVFGGIITFFSGMGMLGASILKLLFAGLSVPVAMLSAGIAGGGLMIYSGTRNVGMVSRFKTYRRLLGSKTTCALDKLARAVGKTVDFVREDLKKMFGKGLFLEGHLDNEKTMLITSDETYREFEQARLRLEAVRKQQAAEAANAPDPRVKEVLDKGSAFIAQIRKCNDDIPGEEVSGKISHMELIVRRIFERVKDHPEVVPDLKKMMDYYLPMTVKLLNAYADMDSQPVQGGTIESSKREIEGTLDTLNRAFEKLLDELFQETALDVSSDISVLQTMLAQEGLTDDELTTLRKQSQ